MCTSTAQHLWPEPQPSYLGCDICPAPRLQPGIHLIQRVHHRLTGAIAMTLMRQQDQAGGCPVALEGGIEPFALQWKGPSIVVLLPMDEQQGFFDFVCLGMTSNSGTCRGRDSCACKPSACADAGRSQARNNVPGCAPKTDASMCLHTSKQTWARPRTMHEGSEQAYQYLQASASAGVRKSMLHGACKLRAHNRWPSRTCMNGLMVE